MTIRERVPLAPLTSFGVGGPARFFVEAKSADDLREASRFAKEHGLPLRVLGGGTNILVGDEGVDAVVVKLCMHDLTFEDSGAEHVLAVIGAGVLWDAFVEAASTRALWGVENLSGIPGTAGGAVV